MEQTKLIKMINSLLKLDNRSINIIINKFASDIRSSNQHLYDEISKLLSGSENFLRSHKPIPPTPVDPDSRLYLIRIENPVIMEHPPIHSEQIQKILKQILLERQNTSMLIDKGIYPTKSIIFQGPPGVGKTMSARWLAASLQLPLITLDLATVISSFLGKTGNNIRAVLDYATSFPCVLLLDEFDAIAKKRNDDRELGELKRLVTVLLQAIDDWPSSSLLIAATNHGELLDPAIWRRFDSEITFTLPSHQMIEKYISTYWPKMRAETDISEDTFNDKSFSYIDKEFKKIQRQKILSTLLSGKTIFEPPITPSTETNAEYQLSLDEKKKLIPKLYYENYSQRSIADRLKISRPTVKKIIDQLKHSHK